MKLDRSHVPWAFFVVIATICAGLLYLANFHAHRVPLIRLPAFFGEIPPLRNTYGGTPLGLFFGFTAFGIFLFASALGIRKKHPLWRIGSVQFWLKAHIWLSILTLPLVLFHCGFRLGGAHTSWLMTLYLLVMGSGFFGLALQQFMPRLMRERLPREVVFEQIAHVRERMVTAGEEVQRLLVVSLEVAKTDPAPDVEPPVTVVVDPPVPTTGTDPSVAILNEFLAEECLPYLRLARGEKHRLGNQRTSDAIFRLLRLSVTERWRPKVQELQGWCDDRRMMDLQTRLHHWLHGWLLVHVPASFALLIFTAWHGWVAVRFLVVFP